MRTLQCLLAAAALATALPAAAAKPVVLRVHHFLASNSNAQVNIIEPWCKRIEEQSEQRMRCQIYPAAQLGGTPAQFFDQARDGVVDIVWTIPTYASGRFTKTEVFELPWITDNAEAGSKAFWRYVEEHAQDEYKGVKPLFVHLHDGTLLHFAGKEPRTLEDLKGLKVRVPTRINSTMIGLLGAVPVQMPLPQVPESVAKGVIDGATVPWEGMPAIKLSEVAKWHLDVPEGMPRMSNTTFLFGMNQAKYDSLPDDLKAVIDANSGLEASGWAGRAGFDEQLQRFQDEALGYGGTIHHITPEEYERWVAATAPIVDEWKKEVAAKGADGQVLYDAARALVTEYSQPQAGGQQ